MNCIDSAKLIAAFKRLNESGLEYILIRNINNELPAALKTGKDIDILVKKKNEKDFDRFFRNEHFEEVVHPLDNDIFLYGTDKFKMYNDRNGIIFDLNFQLAVRSLDAGQWIPLEQSIQQSAWENKRFVHADKSFHYWALSYEDEFIHLITRSVFDKRGFSSDYIEKINDIYSQINMDEVTGKLELVFFKFTFFLLEKIARREYDTIVKDYIQFKEY